MSVSENNVSNAQLIRQATRDLSNLGIEERKSFKFASRKASNRLLSIFPSPVKSNFFNNKFDSKDILDFDE